MPLNPAAREAHGAQALPWHTFCSQIQSQLMLHPEEPDLLQSTKYHGVDQGPVLTWESLYSSHPPTCDSSEGCWGTGQSSILP